MPSRKLDPRAAEVGLRSLESLLAREGAVATAFALEYLGPGIEASIDEAQAVRLQAVRQAVARTEAGSGGDIPEAEAGAARLRFN